MEANEGSAKSIGLNDNDKGVEEGCVTNLLNSLPPHSIVTCSPTCDPPKKHRSRVSFFCETDVSLNHIPNETVFCLATKKNGVWFWEIVNPNKVTQVGQCLVVHFMGSNHTIPI